MSFGFIYEGFLLRLNKFGDAQYEIGLQLTRERGELFAFGTNYISKNWMQVVKKWVRRINEKEQKCWRCPYNKMNYAE